MQERGPHSHSWRMGAEYRPQFSEGVIDMLCKKCCKYERYERNGRVFPLCAVCSWSALMKLLDLPESAVELRTEAETAGQPCPSCNGYGELRDDEAEAFGTCPTCDGTGWAKRP